MSSRIRHLLLLLLVVEFHQLVTAFWPGKNCWIVGGRNHHARRSSPVATTRRTIMIQTSALGAERSVAVEEEGATSDDVNDQAAAQLVLRADYDKESEPAPSTSQASMIDFFRDPKHCTCLISAGNKRESHTVHTTEELLNKWKHRAAKLGGAEPTATDDIISVAVSGISFPGVKVESTSMIGSKLLLPADESGFPSFEFTLIQDKRTATGLPPIVWIFNQLTGAGKKEREKDTTPMSLSRVFVCRSTDDDDDSITFMIKSFLEIRIRFPAVLLKILPVTKEKAEAQGGEAVTKVLKKDIDVSIAKFRDIYVDTVRAI